MTKPASAPEAVRPPEQRQQPDRQDEPDGEGTNATIHHPDDKAAQHPVRPDHKPRSPYVTGNT